MKHLHRWSLNFNRRGQILTELLSFAAHTIVALMFTTISKLKWEKISRNLKVTPIFLSLEWWTRVRRALTQW